MADARAIIRQAHRDADAEIARITETANRLALRMGATFRPIPGRIRAYRRMKARGALIEAGLIKSVGDEEW